MTDYTMYAFYAGQFGLLFAAICSVGILIKRADSEDRPPAYYFIAVWLVGIFCALVLSEPVIYPGTGRLSLLGYGLRLLFGLERAAVLFSYIIKDSRRLSVPLTRRINRYVAALTGLLLLSAGGVSIYTLVSDLRQETKEVKTDLARTAKLATAQRSESAGVQAAKIDTANRTLTVNRQLMRQNVALSREVLQEVANVNARLDRLERTLQRPVIVPTPPKLQPVAPPVKKKGWFGLGYNEGGTLTTEPVVRYR